MEKEKEIRQLGTAEYRQENPTEASRDIEGYALVFDSLSEDLGGFREQIAPEALNDVLQRSDIFALLDHNPDKKLARSRYGKGSLTLSVDEKGLRYSFEAPHTNAGDEAVEAIKRGDITCSSFAFTVAEDAWAKQADGSYIRTIKAFDQLFDVSPVYEPAYQATSVTCARFAEIQEEERIENEKRMAEAEAQAKAEEEAKKAAELDAYFNNLTEEIKNL